MKYMVRVEFADKYKKYMVRVEVADKYKKYMVRVEVADKYMQPIDQKLDATDWMLMYN